MKVAVTVTDAAGAAASQKHQQDTRDTCSGSKGSKVAAGQITPRGLELRYCIVPVEDKLAQLVCVLFAIVYMFELQCVCLQWSGRYMYS